MALRIQSKEGGDRLVIGVAAFIHDVHRFIQADSGKYCTPKDSLPIVKRFLEDIGFPQDKLQEVLHVVEHHEDYGFSKKGKIVKDIETLIVQDADNIDAMGAIGMARTFAFAALLKEPLWIPSSESKRKYHDESKLEVSAIHHFYNKLFKLKNNMNTKTAKKIAVSRHKYMLDFVKQFKDEWYGRK
jgi:uncharacterized protein